MQPTIGPVQPAGADSPFTADPPNLRQTQPDDYPQIQALEASHNLVTLSPQAWRHLWLNNPLAQRADWAIGWVLEDAAGRIVGSLGNVPTRYTYRGREIVAATGRAWVVAPQYRGIALWLMDEYFGQEGVDLFLNNTVNALAVDAFAAFGSTRVPVGNWECAAYWVTGYHGFATAAAKIKNLPLPALVGSLGAGALKLRDTLRAKPLPAQDGSVEIATAPAFDSRFDAFWKELVQQNPDKLLCLRDSATLSWHFAEPLRAGEAWIMTATRNGLLRAYAIFKRQDHAPSGLRRMRLVDYQTLETALDLLPSLLRPALQRCAHEKIHTLEHVGCALPKMKSFDAAAPYRRQLLSWPFYYRAADEAFAAALGNPNVWDPSTYDGDASL